MPTRNLVPNLSVLFPAICLENISCFAPKYPELSPQMLKCRLYCEDPSSLLCLSSFFSPCHPHIHLPRPASSHPSNTRPATPSASHVNEIVSRSKATERYVLIAGEVLISVREGETRQPAGSLHYTLMHLGHMFCF